MTKSQQLRTEKWFWVVNCPAVIALYFWLPALWDKISVLYLILVSLWTQVRNLDGAEQAAEANEKT